MSDKVFKVHLQEMRNGVFWLGRERAECSNRFLVGNKMGFFGDSNGKEFAYSMGDSASIPGSGRSPGGGHDNPLQFSCLENPMDRGAWWATVHGVTKSQTRLSN